MECMEAALKTSLRKDMTMKLSPQTLMEDFNVQNVTPCDDFLFVDDLLDFSHVEQQDEEEEPEQQQQKGGSACVSPHQSHEICNPDNVFCVKDGFSSLPTSELSVPVPFLNLYEQKKSF